MTLPPEGPTRRDLEALANLHLAPVLARLESEGVIMAVVMAPRYDFADGRAVVGSSCANIAETISAFEQAIRELKKGGLFTATEDVS